MFLCTLRVNLRMSIVDNSVDMPRLELKGAPTCAILELSRISLEASRHGSGSLQMPAQSWSEYGTCEARKHIVESVARVSFLKSLVGVLMR